MTNSGLKAHIRMIHEGYRTKSYKSITCELCGKISNSNERHKIHFRAQHTHERIYKCKIEGCSKDYTSNSELIKHFKRVHCQRTSVQCKICNRSVLKLRDHMKNVHEQRNFECTFVEENGTQCTKKYPKQNLLKSHIKTAHQGIKKHICNICDAGFTHLEGLEAHQFKIHFHKRIKCQLCSTLLTKKSYYRRHILLHHKELDEITKAQILDKITKANRTSLFDTSVD